MSEQDKKKANPTEEEIEKTEPGVFSDDTAPGVAAPSLEAQLEAAQRELLYQRAEFENTRKRLLREQEQALKFAHDRLIREIVPVLDLFERGMQWGHDLKAKHSGNKDLENFVGGIDMSHRELVQVLQRFGVEFVGKVGEAFSPDRHEAISMQETEDEKVGTLLAVAVKGCLLHGRLIVPAKVVVGTKKEG